MDLSNSSRQMQVAGFSDPRTPVSSMKRQTGPPMKSGRRMSMCLPQMSMSLTALNVQTNLVHLRATYQQLVAVKK